MIVQTYKPGRRAPSYYGIGVLLLLFEGDGEAAGPTELYFSAAGYYAPGAVAADTYRPGFTQATEYAPGFAKAQGKELE